MKRFTLRRALIAAIVVLAAHAGAAQAGELRVVKDGDTFMAMDGALVIAAYKQDGSQSSHYTYISGLLWQAASSDGSVSTYSYDKDGKLLRITTRTYARDRAGKSVPVSMAGTTQQAVYAGDKLIALASSTGKRLVMAPGLAQRGDMAMRIKSGARRAARVAPPTAAQRAASYNYRMIAISGWELQDSDWECEKTPEDEDVCTGRGERPPRDYEQPPPEGGGGGGGGGGGAPYDPGPPPSENPPDNGGEVGGGGEGGDASASNPQIPTNLPTRESCDAAAYNTYWIMMNQVCKVPKDRQFCEAQAFIIYEDQRAECAAMYP
jgi:YD repeat-containing protein